MPGGFQTTIYNQESPAIVGDKSSQNTMLTHPASLVADQFGIIVGNFAWTNPPPDPDGSNAICTQANGLGTVAGFVYGDTQATNSIYLSQAGLLIPGGEEVALAIGGEFWVQNGGASIVTPGLKAYAVLGTGAVQFGASGATQAANTTSTGSQIQLQTAVGIIGSINGDLLTVTAGSFATPIQPPTMMVRGALIAGPGILGNPQIYSQVSGTPGGPGVYLLTVPQMKVIPSQALTVTWGLFTVGTMTSAYPYAAFTVGQTLSGTGVVAGTQTTQLIGAGTSGNPGGNGATFAANNSTAVGVTGINGAGGIGSGALVETKWVSASTAQPGALVKMTSWVGSLG